MAKEIVLTDVLDRYAQGGKISPKEAQAAVAAAARVRHEFLRDALEKIQNTDPASEEFRIFTRVLESMGTALMPAGIVTGEEMQRLWIAIEMVS